MSHIFIFEIKKKGLQSRWILRNNSPAHKDLFNLILRDIDTKLVSASIHLYILLPLYSTREEEIPLS